MSTVEKSNPRVAFIAKGELFVFGEGTQPRSISSTFMEEAEKRESKSRAVNDWKENTTTWGEGWTAPQMQQFQNAGTQRKKMAFTNVTRDQNANLAFSLGLPGGAGLFRYNCERNVETRLMHRNSFFPSGLTGIPRRQARRSRATRTTCAVGQDGRYPKGHQGRREKRRFKTRTIRLENGPIQAVESIAGSPALGHSMFRPGHRWRHFLQ
jgi:hypothetical protein